MVWKKRTERPLFTNLSISVYLCVCMSVYLSVCLFVFSVLVFFVRAPFCLCVSLTVSAPSCSESIRVHDLHYNGSTKLSLIAIAHLLSSPFLPSFLLPSLYSFIITHLPMPLGRLHLASVFALTMAACAASTEVVNPKERSIKSTSLSIVCAQWARQMIELES